LVSAAYCLCTPLYVWRIVYSIFRLDGNCCLHDLDGDEFSITSEWLNKV